MQNGSEFQNNIFSKRLEEKRIEKGLSQNALAKKVGLSRSLYNKYERAGIRPTHETLILLANELNTTVDFLIGKTSESIPSTHESASITMDLKETILSSKELSEESRSDLLKQMELLKMRDNLKKYKEETSSDLRPRLN